MGLAGFAIFNIKKVWSCKNGHGKVCKISKVLKYKFLSSSDINNILFTSLHDMISLLYKQYQCKSTFTISLYADHFRHIEYTHYAGIMIYSITLGIGNITCHYFI